MARQVTKALGNRYCQARLRAAKYNPDFATRRTAAEQLPGVEEDTLKKYELGLTKVPNTVVALMVDAYNAPELKEWYCCNECPLGYSRVQRAHDRLLYKRRSGKGKGVSGHIN